MICSMTNLILDNVLCYNPLLYICDIGFYPGLDFGLGLDSRGRGQTLEAEAEAEAGYFGLEAEARPRGLTSLTYVGVFYKLSLKLPLKILKMLYYSVIYPRILYGIELYANTYLTYLHDLIILNNRLLRILQHKGLTTNVQHLYIAFNTLPVNKLFQFQVLVQCTYTCNILSIA